MKMSRDLHNHKLKCRLCFQRISGSRNSSEITEKMQQKFFNLTNIEVGSQKIKFDGVLKFIYFSCIRQTSSRILSAKHAPSPLMSPRTSNKR